MRRKNKLPDSLELLLDTMCNTFGAIMFIAISLVIISQFSIKAVKAKKPLDINEEHLGKMRRQVRDLNQTLAEEEQKRAARALAAMGMPESKRNIVDKLLGAKQQNQNLLMDLAQQRAEMDKLEGEAEKSRQALLDLQADKQQLEQELEQVKRTHQQLTENQQARRKDLEKQIGEQQQELETLQKKLDKTKGTTLAFSMETSSGDLSQYVVCLKNGLLYREKRKEVRVMRLGNVGKLVFEKGNVIPRDAEPTLRRLLGEVDKSNFLTVFCDRRSYWILVETRKYMRQRGIKMNFNYTEEFVISFGGEIKTSF